VLKVDVVICSVGRASVLKETVSFLRQQTRPADSIVIVAAEPKDVEGLTESDGVEILYAPRGLCSQRNRSLAHLHGRSDAIVFFDDDFVPRPDYLANLERIFLQDEGVVGVTGALIADGINHAGFTFEEAQSLVDRDKMGGGSGRRWKVVSLYGCNMAFRAAAIGDLRFDEALPFYGWLEDVDFSYQLRARGRMFRTTELRGVHMGVKLSRSPGRRLGYSQIANPVYLIRKGTIPPSRGLRLMAQNITANAVKSLRPEAYVDRWGRLEGNLQAIGDVLRGRVDPTKIRSLA
jgi:GT2 family glycosyltransferase